MPSRARTIKKRRIKTNETQRRTKAISARRKRRDALTNHERNDMCVIVIASFLVSCPLFCNFIVHLMHVCKFVCCDCTVLACVLSAYASVLYRLLRGHDQDTRKWWNDCTHMCERTRPYQVQDLLVAERQIRILTPDWCECPNGRNFKNKLKEMKKKTLK